MQRDLLDRLEIIEGRLKAIETRLAVLETEKAAALARLGSVDDLMRVARRLDDRVYAIEQRLAGWSESPAVQ